MVMTLDEQERAALQAAQAQIETDAVTHEAALQCAWDEGYNQGAKDADQFSD